MTSYTYEAGVFSEHEDRGHCYLKPEPTPPPELKPCHLSGRERRAMARAGRRGRRGARPVSRVRPLPELEPLRATEYRRSVWRAPSGKDFGLYLPRDASEADKAAAGKAFGRHLERAWPSAFVVSREYMFRRDAQPDQERRTEIDERGRRRVVP